MNAGFYFLLLVALVLAAVAIVLWRDLRAKEKSLQEERLKCVRLEIERSQLIEQKAQVDTIRAQLQESFKALSQDSLRESSKMFLDLAAQRFEKLNEMAKGDLDLRSQKLESQLKPIKESLEKFDSKVNDLERTRVEAYSGIAAQFTMMRETQDRLRSETANLVKALRVPHVRGRWGEIQLRRVVEMAGMLNHCDFYEQLTAMQEDSRMRPDVIVRLPGDKSIVVDSKAVISAYIEASQEEDETKKKALLEQHSRHIRERVVELSRKAYWDQFEHSPEFVVLFLPGEVFFSSALETDPSLIEQSVEQKVILATPTTLIALLKAVAYGWKQSALAENAQEISQLGKVLHKRISDMSDHFRDVGTKLSGAVEAYNRTLGTLESRVLVSARKFKDLHAAEVDLEIETLPSIDQNIRNLQVPAAEVIETLSP